MIIQLFLKIVNVRGQRHNKLETNECEGCYSYSMNQHYDNDVCSFEQFNENGECPCTECLIKMMCSNGCEEYLGWSNQKDIKIE